MLTTSLQHPYHILTTFLPHPYNILTHPYNILTTFLPYFSASYHILTSKLLPEEIKDNDFTDPGIRAPGRLDPRMLESLEARMPGVSDPVAGDLGAWMLGSLALEAFYLLDLASSV